MAVESKIRELLRGKTEEITEEVNELDESAARPADKSQGDSTPPVQGSSEANPEQEKLESDDALSADAGKVASAKASKDGSKSASSSNAGDQTSPTQGSSETASTEGQVNKPGSHADVKAEDTESEDEVLEEDITDEEIEAELPEGMEGDEEEESYEEVEEVEGEEDLSEDTLFADDMENLFADEEHLSEEFKVKAANLFEAVVTARVSSEIDEIKAELAEEAAVAQETFMEEMVQKIDGYLNYVAENWMKENELAIERGLRNEITESFVGSLKQVFAEHYIDIPEEKYDVLGEMQSEIESLKEKLDESTNEKVELSAANVDLSKSAAIREATSDLTDVEAEKFAKLVEDVEFDGDYDEKLSVIKENYFPSQKASQEEDKLVDDETIDTSDGSSPISIYAQAISKSVKR